MILEDYKELTKLRVRNYIYILRMLTQIDETLYDVVKKKILQIHDLVVYLELYNPDEENQSSEIDRVYQRLKNSKQIFDIEGDEYEDVDLEDTSDEYVRFFKGSQLDFEKDASDNLEYNTLINEEQKWKVRAQWIEEQVLKLKAKDSKWVAWLEAKINSLIDLDIQFDKIAAKKPSATQDTFQILYLQEFLQEILDNQKKKKDKGGDN